MNENLAQFEQDLLERSRRYHEQLREQGSTPYAILNGSIGATRLPDPPEPQPRNPQPRPIQRWA